MIEKNMYIRSCNGIQKVLKVYDNTPDEIIRYETDVSVNHYLLEDSRAITKASYNIIDLIEEGDYVNGNKVIYVEDLDALEYLFIDADGNSYYSGIDKECNKPKSIVTHEQFENMEYKIEN